MPLHPGFVAKLDECGNLTVSLYNLLVETRLKLNTQARVLVNLYNEFIVRHNEIYAIIGDCMDHHTNFHYINEKGKAILPTWNALDKMIAIECHEAKGRVNQIQRIEPLSKLFAETDGKILATLDVCFQEKVFGISDNFINKLKTNHKNQYDEIYEEINKTHKLCVWTYNFKKQLIDEYGKLNNKCLTFASLVINRAGSLTTPEACEAAMQEYKEIAAKQQSEQGQFNDKAIAFEKINAEFKEFSEEKFSVPSNKLFADLEDRPVGPENSPRLVPADSTSRESSDGDSENSKKISANMSAAVSKNAVSVTTSQDTPLRSAGTFKTTNQPKPIKEQNKLPEPGKSGCCVMM